MAPTDGKPIFVSTFHDDDQLASLYAAAKLGERPAHAIVEAFGNSRYRIFAVEARDSSAPVARSATKSTAL
jgi:hypothetical protein